MLLWGGTVAAALQITFRFKFINRWRRGSDKPTSSFADIVRPVHCHASRRLRPALSVFASTEYSALRQSETVYYYSHCCMRFSGIQYFSLRVSSSPVQCRRKSRETRSSVHSSPRVKESVFFPSPLCRSFAISNRQKWIIVRI